MYSIIFQGAIGPKEAESLQRSIKKLKSYNSSIEVIISTWESNSDNIKCIEGLVDKIILNLDLPTYKNEGFRINNVHRQIATSKSGIEKAKYNNVVKLRADIEVSNVSKLLKCCEISFELKKVGVISYSSIDPLKNNFPLYYHVCDWVYIGSKSELSDIFSCPLPTSDYYYFNCENLTGRLAGYSERLRPEEYICSYTYRQSHWHSYTPHYGFSKFKAIRSNLQISRYFKVFDFSDLGIVSIKHQVGNVSFNRYDKFSYLIWNNVPNNRFLKMLWKIVVSVYYKQSIILQQCRRVRGWVKLW